MRANDDKLQKEKPMITVMSNNLAPVLSRAVGIVKVRDMLPILKCVMLTADGGRLTIDANNLEMATRETIPASEGSAKGCIDTVRLHAVVSKLPENSEIVMEFQEEALILKTKSSRIKLEMLSPSEFPVFSESDYTAKFTMDGKDLAKALSHVIPFVSDEETRFYLGGVNVRAVMNDKIIRFAASDGISLGVVRLPLSPEINTPYDVIIPTRAIEELVKGLTDTPVKVSVSPHNVSFETNTRLLISKVIGSEYPDIERVIPTPGENIWCVDRAEFLNALGLATAAARSERTIVVRIELSEDKTTISVTSGPNDTVVEMDGAFSRYTGNPIITTFQSHLLERIVKLAAKMIELRFDDDAKLFLARDVDDGTSVYVAMGRRG